MKKILPLGVLGIYILVGCIVHYGDTRLQVYNNSNINIYVQPDNDTSILLPHADIGFKLDKYYIKSDSSIKMKKPGGKNAWEDYINKSPDKKLHLYVFSDDTLRNYTTEQIIEGKKYLKRIDVSLKELKANDWEIIYSGEN